MDGRAGAVSPDSTRDVPELDAGSSRARLALWPARFIRPWLRFRGLEGSRRTPTLLQAGGCVRRPTEPPWKFRQISGPSPFAVRHLDFQSTTFLARRCREKSVPSLGGTNFFDVPTAGIVFPRGAGRATRRRVDR